MDMKMKIELQHIKIKDLVAGFENDEMTGAVYGFGGKLNIRPKYQREFVYGDKQQKEVIRTIKKRFPLNIMYWSKNVDGTFELLDGQQRTMSICRYLAGQYSVDGNYFHSLTPDEMRQIEDYELTVYVCEGSERDKLDWFRIVNIAGEKLELQELRNSVYTGDWLTSAKKFFSGNNPPANGVGRGNGKGGYLAGSPLRQKYLETVLDWISGGNIEEYMSQHQRDKNADELRDYYEKVIEWADEVFPKYRKEMMGLPWGEFYNTYKNDGFEDIGEENERRIKELLEDEEVGSNRGVYQYILTNDEKYLNLRNFDNRDRRIMYERQRGVCPICRNYFNIEEMDADHIVPWSQGGKTTLENGQMLCRKCNHEKSNRY